LELGQEGKVDIMNRMYNRVLEKELIDMTGKNEVMASEVKAVRKTLG